MNFAKALHIAYPYRDQVDIDLNRYLAKQDREDARCQAIADRAEELLAGEYAPFRPENVSEALGEISNSAIAAIALGLSTGSNEVVGSILSSMIKGYWEKLAKDKAEYAIDLEAEACRGCPHANSNCQGC